MTDMTVWQLCQCAIWAFGGLAPIFLGYAVGHLDGWDDAGQKRPPVDVLDSSFVRFLFLMLAVGISASALIAAFKAGGGA